MYRFNLGQLKAGLLVSLMAFPVCILAADENYVSKLNNMSKDSDVNKYYLVKDKTWSKDECVVNSGKERINPGESTTLEIKKGCTWGGVSYKIFKVANDENLGILSHSFRDGSFTMDISMPCSAAGCNFYDLSPQQLRETHHKTKN